MNTLLFGLVFLAPPFLKKILLRWFHHAHFGHAVQLGWFSAIAAQRIEMGPHSIVRPLSLIRLQGDFRLGAYSEISSFNLIYGSSSLRIGDQSYIGPQSLINVEEPVHIGNGSALGPRNMLFTHGSYLPFNEGYWVRRAGVTLGNKVWCAAGVFIHPGVQIGDDTFVNSGAVVTRSIPPGSVVEGNPAQVVYPIERVKHKMTPKRLDMAMARVLNDFAEIGLRRALGIAQTKQCGDDGIQFRWRQHWYQIILVRSDRPTPVQVVPRTRQIIVTNHPNCQMPSTAMIFDLTTMQTIFQPDPIHTALRLFMLRYYGIRFKDGRLEETTRG